MEPSFLQSTTKGPASNGMELDFSHHAYLLEGDTPLVLADVHAAIARTGAMVAGNPNIFFAEYDSVGIDESRELKARQSMKGFAEGRKFMIIAARSFTHEAQNALLKTFEEPAADTRFVIIMPDASGLLPTLRSRLLAVASARQPANDMRQSAQKFLWGDVVERMSVVKKMIEDKDKASATRFIEALEHAAYAQFKSRRTPAQASALADLERYREYLNDRAPSVKMILEHLALTLPQA